ncbi:MAG: hypothetical protein WCB04_00530 [Mycobacteriales bacterium]
MTEDFDRVVREALEQEALSHEPSGDGLTRIRARIDARRNRLRWLVPGVGLAAVTAAIVGVLVVPNLLPSSATDRPPVSQLGSPGGSADPSTPAESPGTGPLQDMVTVWPYSSRSEATKREPAAVAAGQLPGLSDAKSAALYFVREFVRVLGPLQVLRTEPLEAGVGVTLGRANPNGQLFDVTTVYLVRVSREDSAPYVVVRADAPDLRITDVSSGGSTAVTVTGSVGGPHQSVQARLISTSGRPVAVGYDGAAGSEKPWKVVLGNAANVVPKGRYAVVAQTSSDADGYISQLVVLAYDQS